LLPGFVGLAKGAGGLGDGGATLARRWRVDPLLVGLTVVAWGTSIPELVVSGMAAWKGQGEMSLGNSLGSNVANIGLVMGSSAILLPAVMVGGVRPREIFWLLGSLAALWLACMDGRVTRLEGLGLLTAFGVYMELLRRHPRGVPGVHPGEEHGGNAWLLVIAGSLVIVVGARLVVLGGEGLAFRAGISPMIVGLVFFALGTSLPELAAGIGSALKGHADIGYGNVIGSNVFNVLAVIGAASEVRPLGVGAGDFAAALGRDFPVAMVFSLVLVLLPFAAPGRFGRGKGVLLLLGYLGYIGFLFLGERL
jgi:cation:H+ antiporter